MPANIKALVLIIIAGLLAWLLYRKVFDLSAEETAAFDRRVVCLGQVMILHFLVPSIWLFYIITAIIVYIYASQDSDPILLYLILLFSLPWYDANVSTFGIIKYHYEFDLFKILNLAILLPLIIGKKNISKIGLKIGLAEVLLLIYYAYVSIRLAEVMSFPSILRHLIDVGITVLLPYFAFLMRRATLESWRTLCISMTFPLVIIAILSPLESIDSWLLFQSAREWLGVPPPKLSLYLTRGEAGLTRAIGPFHHAIVMGYVMMIALIIVVFGMKNVQKLRQGRLIVAGIILVGLLMPLSRGPWLGVIAGAILTLLASRTLTVKRFTLLVMVYLCLGGIIISEDLRKLIFNYLPLVGGADIETVDYRSRLMDVGLEVLLLNPLFGSLFFIHNPMLESLRQGQGIIDIVNSYLGIALPYGLLGLAFFILMCIIPIAMLLRKLADKKIIGAARMIFATLLGSVVAMLITLGTVSMIGCTEALLIIFLALSTRASRESWSSK